MNLEHLSRLRAMAAPESKWDLSPNDTRAIEAAIDTMPNPRLVTALEAVLLYHCGGAWDEAKKHRWWSITHQQDATTKTLCDHIRAVLAEVAP